MVGRNWAKTVEEAVRLTVREDVTVREQATKLSPDRSEWKPQWKLKLIRSTNPNWRDLYEDLNA